MNDFGNDKKYTTTQIRSWRQRRQRGVKGTVIQDDVNDDKNIWKVLNK